MQRTLQSVPPVHESTGITGVTAGRTAPTTTPMSCTVSKGGKGGRGHVRCEVVRWKEAFERGGREGARETGREREIWEVVHVKSVMRGGGRES